MSDWWYKLNWKLSPVQEKNATYQPLQEIKEHFGERVRLIE